MNELPPFVKKYVSTTYYNQLNWSERAAYLRGIQDVMGVFNKELETRAMLVLQRKAHWLEPKGSVPVEYSSSQRTTTTAASTPTFAQTVAAVTAAPSAKAGAPLNGAKASQATNPSPQSSQPFMNTHSSSSQPSSQYTQSSATSTTSQPHLKRKVTEPATLDREITFVGMRYRGGHEFSPKDQVKLERDHKNPVDKNAIKVMVFKNGTWIHVAYVGRDDASALKDQLGIEHMKLTYLRTYLASVKYRLQA
ncbi:MAG: hypothetical protein J3R72DRAFT_432839 [Linnemannia gamsii]|nr:MAG: hypothetical protein J3R72DRAFT_432839 [Linnemannia gamsii]